MRAALFVAALALSAGCILNEDKPILRFVCPGGQLADDPGLCPEPQATTTTAPPETTTTEEPTTSTTEPTTTSTTQPPTPTTPCKDQSLRGYLIVNDVDESCYRGYTFMLDSDRWDCTDKGICSIGLWAKSPDGTITPVKARRNLEGGISFQLDGMTGEVVFTREDKTANLFSGVVRFV